MNGLHYQALLCHLASIWNGSVRTTRRVAPTVGRRHGGIMIIFTHQQEENVPYDPHKHHRRSIRLKGYDYALAGAYFVTICTHKRQPLFGKIVDGKMRLSLLGQLVYAEWQKTAVIRPNIYLDAFVVMPNHLHGIIVIFMIDDAGETRQVVPATLQKGSLGAIVGQFKSKVTKRYRRFRKNDDSPIWQRNYYEQIIRNERHLTAVQQYIHNNPANWVNDDYFGADGS